MNILAFYNLIVLTMIRVLGLSLSIEFFINQRKKRFIAPIAGWSCWVITGFIAIIADNIPPGVGSEILFILNAILGAEGLVLIVMGILSYFRFVPGRIMFIISLVYLIFPLIFYSLFGDVLALSLAMTLNFATYVVISLLVIYKGKEIHQTIRGGVKWVYITLITVFIYILVSFILIFSVEDYTYGLYYSSDNFAIMSNYLVGILLTILIIVILIHLERGIADEGKTQLKDRYSHDIGNILQIIVTAASVIEMKGELDDLDKPNLNLIQAKCNEAGELIKEIREL
ncbi:MAG: hypothetical protein JSV04_10165 [Candidatus Heimdallarchaeota archaeon]|nr:MAG: hypothetical protein JSV04_10165 [Candidatus Heimdallarchaeota archaeon]